MSQYLSFYLIRSVVNTKNANIATKKWMSKGLRLKKNLGLLAFLQAKKYKKIVKVYDHFLLLPNIHTIKFKNRWSCFGECVKKQTLLYITLAFLNYGF